MSDKKLPLEYNSSRRQFVKTAASAGLAAAAFTVSPWGSLRAWSDTREYDYIVIGSGAGGGTVAARLVQKGKRVLVLEAGRRQPVGARKTLPIFDPQQPITHAFASEDPNLAWGFYVKHYKDLGEAGKKSEYTDQMNRCFQQNVYGDPKRTGIFYPRGSTLGGSTATNAMITLYPDPSEWDQMGSYLGDSEWSSARMWDMFKRLNPNHDEYTGRWDTRLGERQQEWEKEALTWAKPWLQNQKIDENILRILATDTVTIRILFAAVVGTYFSGRKALKDAMGVEVQDFMRGIKLTDGISLEKARNDFRTLARALYNRVEPNTAKYVYRKTEGFLDIPKATLRGRRFGTRDLLEKMERDYPAHGRQEGSLEILDETLVKRVLFAFPSGGNPVAIGVEAIRGGSYGADILKDDLTPGKDLPSLSPQRVEYKLAKGGEVILAGGAFNSPQLLMLSGIGAKRDLENLGIGVVRDLPGVGKNLQDRYEVTVTMELEKGLGVLENENCKIGQPGDQCLDVWNHDASRNIYQSNGVLAAVTLKSGKRAAANGSPDLMAFCVGGEFVGYKLHYTNGAARNNLISWAVLKGHTNNTAGEVRLRSKDPHETPLINFNYFDEGSDGWKDDLDAVVDGVKFVRKDLRKALWLSSKGLRHSAEFKRTRGWKERLPQQALDEIKAKNDSAYQKSSGETDGALKDWVRRNAWGHHASCTCKMGPSADPMAVVDSKFRVHGVDNLRVVDASVFPKIPGLFIVVPTYLMGEKAADAIVGDEFHRDPNARRRG